MNTIIHEPGWRTVLFCFSVAGISLISLLSLMRQTAKERQDKIEADLNKALQTDQDDYDPADVLNQAPTLRNSLLRRPLMMLAHAVMILGSLAIGLPAFKSASYTHQGNQAVVEHDYETAVKRYTSAVQASFYADYLLVRYQDSLAERDAKGGELNNMRRLASLHPGNDGIHNDLGNQLMQHGDLVNAIKEYQQAVMLNPNNAVVHNNLGNALQSAHRYPESIVEFRQAIHLDPNQIPTYYNLANTLYSNEQIAESVEYYRIAIDRNPKLIPAYYNLAQALARQGKRDQAMVTMDSFLQIAPGQPEFADAIVKARGQLADWRKLQ